MRALIAAILLLTTSAVLADGAGDAADASSRAPTAAEVIGDLYRFDRFQQHLLEKADLDGNQEVRGLAALRAEDAVKRDKALKQIQREIGAEPTIDETPSAGLPPAPDDSEGVAYIRQFYAAQVSGYRLAVDSIERYLKAPDHDRLSAFAREQLPLLQSQLEEAERSMADK
jgi:hypothetical protein